VLETAKQMKMQNQSPLTVFEFNGTTVRICRSVSQKSRRVVTHCFSFEAKDFEKEAGPLIAKALKAHKLKPDNVILSLPRYATLSRFLRLPSNSDEEIKDMVSLHISREKAFGNDKEKEIVYDYQKVGFDEEGRALVSIFLIQKSSLKLYLEILEKLGIIPNRVTLNTEGLLRWTLRQEKNEGELGCERCFFFLNIDHGYFDFNAVVQGRSIFSRTFILSKQESLDQTQWLAKEIKLCIELFRRSFGNLFKVSDQLYLTGMGEDFKKSISWETLPWTIENLDLLDDMNLKPKLKQEMLKAGVSFASVLGLVLKEGERCIDITPAELKAKVVSRLKWLMVRQITLFVALFALILSLFVLRGIDLKTKELNVLRREMTALTPIEKTMQEAQKASFIDKEILKTHFVTDIFYEFYDLTPAAVSIMEFRLEETKTLAIAGTAQDPATVFHYLDSLKNSKFLKDVRLDYVNANPKLSGESVRFRVTASLKER
jgi:Tfp pilus assembly protein PilN